MVWFLPYLLIIYSSIPGRFIFINLYFVTDTILVGYFQCWGGCFNRTWHSFPPNLCEHIVLISSFHDFIFYDTCHLSLPCRTHDFIWISYNLLGSTSSHVLMYWKIKVWFLHTAIGKFTAWILLPTLVNWIWKYKMITGVKFCPVSRAGLLGPYVSIDWAIKLCPKVIVYFWGLVWVLAIWHLLPHE